MQRPFLASRVRPIWIALTVVLLGFAAWEAVLLWGLIDDQSALGADLRYYRFVAERWLETGIFYTEDQLSGPYQVRTLVDNLYPPHALLLFVPFIYLPSILWWILPLGFTAYIVWWLRPGPAAWAAMAAILAMPVSLSTILYGNTHPWLLAFVAGGIRWGWPAFFITIKPSVLFLAPIGILRRSWWAVAVISAGVTLPLLPLWLQWPTVIRNSTVTAEYSLAAVPFMLIPVVAWLGSPRRGAFAMPTLDGMRRRLRPPVAS
jgi:hypothetical protein